MCRHPNVVSIASRLEVVHAVLARAPTSGLYVKLLTYSVHFLLLELFLQHPGWEAAKNLFLSWGSGRFEGLEHRQRRQERGESHHHDQEQRDLGRPSEIDS